MCGIVGVLSRQNCVPILIDGLKKLEYRGYDSAGLAIQLDGSHAIERARSVGRVAELETISKGLEAHLGIAHTRWATHGVPSERNAHPHISTGQGVAVTVVHNGIIENHEEIRRQLRVDGYQFNSDTDTEVIAHLTHKHLKSGLSLLKSVQASVAQLEGAFAIALICDREPATLVAAKKGAPLLVGLGQDEYFLASDASALVSQTKMITYLEEGDTVCISPKGLAIQDAQGRVVERPVIESQLSADAVELGPYDHYMQKEIFEQPGAIAATLEMVSNASAVTPELFGTEAAAILPNVQHILILACGTSFHAASVARYWLESIAGVPTTVEIASEYRYRKSVPIPDTLVITVSQSGETADTLAALEHAKSLGMTNALSICNVPESALIRASNLRFLTRAGPEIGVASTKAFTTQLAAFFTLTMVMAKLRATMTAEQEKTLLAQLRHLPLAIQNVLSLEPEIKALAQRFASKRHALFLGRGVHFPIAQEGALKLKEISYIHAEAYAAGELKHGPLALVDADMPVVAIAPKDTLIEKLKSNLQEVKARGGELYIFADRDTRIEASEGVHVINLLDHAGHLSPILHVLPLQLLSYHVALVKGTDVDKPRNLAKSVTVE
ncbi:MAG TPA: glutamine--fructose-6-phosphate transaminase (isomerizing) [Limnobacter sp.]|uniref:glutamine--fructose-6-phosphate transaminase (isomerizing) n=1 Tax=Limnobacter sp. TaxID=2003368 RepID=UPI002E31743F|nr:glutamine--fructose-6-phosphate transaminase (isomerizing) [Limnobacter sp.]HEX5486323.1 glutamine--fructose-6-phosphate transaminase (isomerizing) [Limnobacter sp.]